MVEQLSNVPVRDDMLSVDMSKKAVYPSFCRNEIDYRLTTASGNKKHNLVTSGYKVSKSEPAVASVQ